MKGLANKVVSGISLLLVGVAAPAVQAAAVPGVFALSGASAEQSRQLHEGWSSQFSDEGGVLHLASEGRPHTPASEEAAEPQLTPEEKAAKEEHKRQEQQTGQHQRHQTSEDTEEQATPTQ